MTENLPDASYSSDLITRSPVEPGLPYLDYRQTLRKDFIYSCGYCTLSEFEAQGLRFTIDHYEPCSARPDLKNEYSNLIYACDECNVLKGDLSPPSLARAEGYRFYRPDEDRYTDHFAPSRHRLNHITKVGHFTIEALDLNRQSLRRLRELRERLIACNEFVTQGVLALRGVRIDRLPQAIKGRALLAIRDAAGTANDLEESIDQVLRSAASSPLLDVDVEKEGRRRSRNENFIGWRALFPGAWRGRKQQKADTSTDR